MSFTTHRVLAVLYVSLLGYVPLAGGLGSVGKLGSAGSHALANPPAVESQPSSAIGTILRVATSDEGFRFVETGEVFLRNAADPNLVRLPNGELLATFACTKDVAEKTEKNKSTDDGSLDTHTLADSPPVAPKSAYYASRSKDEGKTWSHPRPIRIQGLPDELQVVSPTMLVMPSGLVRMYFAVPAKAERTRAAAECVIMSAVTRDGVEYQLDRDVRVVCQGISSAQPIAYWTDRKMVLIVAGKADKKTGSTAVRGMAQQFTSRDGRSFNAADRVRPANEMGQVVQLDAHHWRMYVTQGNEIRARMSSDGLRWRDEADACLKGGFDAAVAPLDGRKYLMLFCAQADKPDAAKPPLVNMPATAATAPPTPAPGQAGQANTPTETSDASADWDAFADAGFDSELGEDWNQADGSNNANTGYDAADGFAPVPDLSTKFDYLAWYDQNCIPPADQNAYYSYSDLIDRVKNRPEGLLKDRYNDMKDYGPPEPWDPLQYPEWEASYQATQDLIDVFRTASRDTRPFSTPPKWSEDTPADGKMLISMQLSSMGSFRAMTRATLAQAWRTENGVVPPAQMQDAIVTVLGNANHLQQGATLIERLVGIAERNLAQDDARWALQRGVFKSANDIKATLNLLHKHDQPDRDTSWIRTEHACTMDTVQYLFEPTQPGSDPQIQIDRINKISGENPTSEEIEALKKLTPYYVKAGLQEVDAYYRKVEQVWQTSFPGPASENTDTMLEEINKKYPQAGTLLPSLTRVYEITRRQEASRRATQLAYGIELYKARNGRYPGSLDELPAEHTAEVRTDPFSGQDFIYRRTDTGPSLYSVSVDGTDDGGTYFDNWGNNKKKGDYIFWPPQE